MRIAIHTAERSMCMYSPNSKGAAGIRQLPLNFADGAYAISRAAR